MSARARACVDRTSTTCSQSLSHHCQSTPPHSHHTAPYDSLAHMTHSHHNPPYARPASATSYGIAQWTRGGSRAPSRTIFRLSALCCCPPGLLSTKISFPFGTLRGSSMPLATTCICLTMSSSCSWARLWPFTCFLSFSFLSDLGVDSGRCKGPGRVGSLVSARGLIWTSRDQEGCEEEAAAALGEGGGRRRERRGKRGKPHLIVSTRQTQRNSLGFWPDHVLPKASD